MDGSTDSGVPWGELELLREGLSAAGVGAWTWDIVRDQVLWSRNVASIFAVDPAEFGGSYEAYLELLDGPARALVTGEVGRCLSGEIDSYLLVHPLDRPGRERRYLECRGRIWRGVEGQPLRMAGTVVDVTEKRAARLSLEREQALRGAVIAAGAMGLVVCERAGNVVLANPRAEVLLGSQSLTGRDLRGIFPSGELGAQLASLVEEAALARATVFGRRFTRVVGARRLQLSVNAAPICQGPGEGEGDDVSHVVLGLDDVSELLDGETERGELREQLEHARRLESIGRLAGGVAHDFNNLLTVILSYCDRAARPGAAQAAESLGHIREAAEKAADVTSQLLSFARRQSAQPAHVDVARVLRDLEELLARAAGDRVSVRLSLPDASAVVYLDRSRFEQAVLNVVANARDAMPCGGTVEISVRERKRLVGATHERDVVVEVADDGVGMDPQAKQRAFEPFFTTKARGAGTGLGLASVHGFVQQAGGSITLESEPGLGTRVVITLPSSGQPESVLARTESLPPRGVGTVLLVEDTDPVRRVSARVLSDHGYRVVEASSAREALALVRGAPVDCAVVDVLLPDQSGPELVDELRALSGEIPVVFVSGYSEGRELRASQRFLQKPYTPPELLRVLREVISAADSG